MEVKVEGENEDISVPAEEEPEGRKTEDEVEELAFIVRWKEMKVVVGKGAKHMEDRGRRDDKNLGP